MPIPVRVLRFNQRYLNKLTIKLAGRGYFADLEHVGRKPGVTYHTPIMAFRHGDTLTIALTYGPNVQWLKNIRAAGHCQMRLGHETLKLGAPLWLDFEAGLARMPIPIRSRTGDSATSSAEELTTPLAVPPAG